MIGPVQSGGGAAMTVVWIVLYVVLGIIVIPPSLWTWWHVWQLYLDDQAYEKERTKSGAHTL